MRHPPTLGERVGIGTGLLATAAAMWTPWAAVPVLGGFVAACLTAVFFPGWGFYLPVVSRGRSGRPAVALTFDDGPDPRATPALLDLLERHRAPATFFVTGKRASAMPELIRDMVDRGHEIGNHTYRHDVFLALKHPRTVAAEIAATDRVLETIGIRTAAFRPPVGIVSPRIAAAARADNRLTVLFSRRGWDAGNRRIKGLAQRLLREVRADDILLLHDAVRGGDRQLARWCAEIDQLLIGLRERGLDVLPLSELIRQPVMARLF